MASIRQQIVDEVYRRLRQITEANGYTREVGAEGVLNAKVPPQGSLPTPAILVLQEPDDPPNETASDSYIRTMDLAVGFVDSEHGDDPDAEANEFLADIQRAMAGTLHLTVDRIVGGTQVLKIPFLEFGAVLNQGAHLANRIYGQVSYRLTYRTSRDDPSKMP